MRMSLNTDFWNMAQEDFPERYGMRRFTKSYKNLILDGDLPLNQEWDKTISPWAMSPRMGVNAHYQNDLINRCWLYPDINTMKGISDSQPFEDDYIIKTSIAAQPQHEFPFIVMCGDGGQGVALPNPGWTGRISPDQEATDANFGNVKTRFYMLTEFEYKRLVWLIRVYIASEGYNSPNYSTSRWHYGSWYDLGDITDAMYADILSGTKSITGIKFIPYYASTESQPNERRIISSTGFLSLADTQPLDGSASGLGINAPYSTDYIDYSLTAFANYATSDYENNSYTFSLGSTGGDVYHNNFRCKISTSEWFTSTVEWAEGRPSWGVDGNFTETIYRNGIGTDSTFWKTEGLNSSSWMYMYYRQRLDESLLNTKEKIRDYILTQAAYLGCWFVERSGIAMSSEMSKNNPDAYIGVIESDGLTHGQYQKGSEIDAPNADWVNPWEESPYVPYVPDPDPTEWDEDQTSVLQTTTGDPAYGTKEFLMTETALQQLLKVMEEFKVAEAEEEIVSGFCEKAFGYTDPIESIVSVIKYPFDMINNWNGSGLIVSGSDVGSYLSIANAQIPVSIGSGSAPPFTILIPSAHDIYEIAWSSSVWKYGRAYIPYFQKFENFMAYEPFCTASLYVPFCGSVRLDPEVYVSHSVGVEYYVSPLDGTCKAYILRDNLVIDTLTGNIGTSIEINSSDDLAKANNINLLNSNIQAQKMNLLKQAASFSVGSALSAGLNPTTGAASMVRGALDLTFSAMQTENAIDRLEYQIDTTQTPFKQLQPGGGYLSSCDEWGVRLVAYRPEPLPGYSFSDWKDYGRTTGFACLITSTLSEFSGYTECSNVVADGIPCTATEKKMIIDALQSGVYL